MDNSASLTLTPTPPTEETLLTFGEALLEVCNGKKIARKEWANSDYGFLKDTFLAIYRNGETFNTWQVNDGDILATDWFVIQEN